MPVLLSTRVMSAGWHAARMYFLPGAAGIGTVFVAHADSLTR